MRLSALCHLMMLVVIGMSSRAVAHGVSVVELQKGVGLALHYDDGSAMSYSETVVYAPDSADTAFQEGLTDRNGRFVFFPDSSGEWRIVINDGMGHGVVHSMIINDKGISIKQVDKGFDLKQKIIMGCSIIFGITGMLSFFATRRERRR